MPIAGGEAIAHPWRVIFACPACDSRHDVTGLAPGQLVRCRCGAVTALEAPSSQAGVLTCPRCGAAVATGETTCGHCATPLLLKACPRCLARVFHGHKHCGECGTALTLAATEEPAAERPCPRCDRPLAPHRIADVVIDECHGCGGVFLDQVAIQRVIADRQQVRAEALLGALPRQEISPLPAGSRMYVKCPLCRVVMNRRQFTAGSGVVVDVCKTHGTFFDAGELPRTIELVMNGGLERAERRQLEALREAAKREQQNARFSAMMAVRSSTRALSEASRADGGTALIELLSALWR